MEDLKIDKDISICHETIYRYILRNKKLKKYLRCQKGKYRRRYGSKKHEKQRELAKKRWIGTRPDVINNRERIGDWEGDTIVGKSRKQRIITHVDRLSGYLLADKIERITKETMREKIVSRLKKLPRRERLSITYDNGTEFNDYELIERYTKAIVYHANPYSSWERGTNENTNGLVRQFFPKGSSFDTVTQKDVDRVVKLLNHRPRKRLGYLTPTEVFHCSLD